MAVDKDILNFIAKNPWGSAKNKCLYCKKRNVKPPYTICMRCYWWRRWVSPRKFSDYVKY